MPQIKNWPLQYRSLVRNIFFNVPSFIYTLLNNRGKLALINLSLVPATLPDLGYSPDFIGRGLSLVALPTRKVLVVTVLRR